MTKNSPWHVGHSDSPQPEAPPTLWRNGGFIRLWTAQAMSHAGNVISQIAFPLTAIEVLGATPAQMAMLRLASSLPNFFFSLFAGVWVDRLPRRPILIAADLGRALLIGSIPVAALLGLLTFPQLVVVAFASAILSVFFILASMSILPSLVEGDRLVEANSRFATTDSVVSITGPSLAGGLVQWITAPLALLGDALSYLLSAFLIGNIDVSETRDPSADRNNIWHEIGEGIHELLRTPLLRALTTSAGAGSFGGAVQGPVLMLFLYYTLNLSTVLIGFFFSCAAVGSLIGATLAGQTARRIGMGRAIILGNFLWFLGGLLIPFAGIAGAFAPVFADLSVADFLLLATGQVLAGMGATIYTVNQISLRQQITPNHLFGRVIAARRVFLFGLMALGAVAGGYLGETVGLRPTLFAGALLFGLGFVLVALSPVRHQREITPVEQ